MKYSLDDTIVAIATPPGRGALGIVRLSGRNAFEIASGVLLRPSKDVHYNFRELPSHTVHYGFLSEPQDGSVIDEVMFSVFRAPKSYTKEDMVEVTCHGGFCVLNWALNVFLQKGARMARAGEFTLRAFLNGRLDLAQAEGVLDVIEAQTPEGVKIALGQLEGRLSHRLQTLANALKKGLVQLEASIDFPEEEINVLENKKEIVTCSLREIESLLAGFKGGRIHREGVKTIIVGLPNVGKSSLFNALLEEDRTIVADTPGTTRDIVESGAIWNGVFFKLMDTAGLRESCHPVEGEGVKRTRKYMGEADLIIMVLDVSRPLKEQELAIARGIKEKGILVVNKVDLLPAWGADELRILGDMPLVQVSAKRGDGLDELKKGLAELALKEEISSGSGEVLLSNIRHVQALSRAKDALLSFMTALEEGLTAEFLADDMRNALEALGEITGETTPEDVLESIFSRFCIGK